MKVSVVPVIVAGGILVGALVNSNLNRKDEREELNSIINKLESDTKAKDNELKSKIDEILNLKKEVDKKEKKVEELEKKLAQKRQKSKQLVASRGQSVDLSSGQKGRYLGVFHATAYDDTPQSQGKWVGQTATGVKPQHGVIAVDPKVIPLGTKLWVEGYGNCIAGDTGGAIKGKRLDLFFSNRQDVMTWGRKNVKVYIRE